MRNRLPDLFLLCFQIFRSNLRFCFNLSNKKRAVTKRSMPNLLVISIRSVVNCIFDCFKKDFLLINHAIGKICLEHNFNEITTNWFDNKNR